MKRLFLRLYILITAFVMMACESEEIHAASPDANTPPNNGNNKTLVVYYSYTNTTEQIVSDLLTLIDADVIEVEPAEKGLNYAANNYKIGTDQLNKIKTNPDAESSYPAIDAVSVDMSKYNTIIIATPLWWSQMASNMQTFLFKYGPEMAGKNVGLIVKSASSTIGGVESDAKRLVPDGKFMSTSLWIKDSNYSNRKSLLDQWLKDVNLNNITKTTSTMNLIVNNHTLKVTLADNSATQALLSKLKDSPIRYNAHDYGGFEKVGALGFSLPSSDVNITTETGDIMLYTSNQLCIFFESNSWEYTRIGKIEGMTEEQLKEAFGSGEVSITLSLGEPTAIKDIPVNKTTTTGIYNLNGQCFKEAPAKGMYIENGVKKVR